MPEIVVEMVDIQKISGRVTASPGGVRYDVDVYLDAGSRTAHAEVDMPDGGSVEFDFPTGGLLDAGGLLVAAVRHAPSAEE